MKTREFLFGLVTIAAMVAAHAAKTENHTVYVEDEMSRTVPGFATLIAHRGESVDAPENSLPAYRLACSRGFGFECDVSLSSDKRVITYHNSSIPLVQPDGTRKDTACSAACWESEISRHDITGEKGMEKFREGFSPTHPALLSDVLKLARNGRWIYVETKPGPEIVPYVKAILEKQSVATPENTLFISFNSATVKALKNQMGSYKAYWISPVRRGWSLSDPPKTSDEILAALKECGADGIDLQWDRTIVNERFVRAIRAAGYEFHVWTVDDLAEASTAFSRGVQTVTTNCAKKLLDGYSAARK